MSDLNELLNCKYVKIKANEGIWEVLDFDPKNTNILILRNIDTGYSGKFNIYEKGNLKIIPIDREELNKYIIFERKFNIPIWYVISNEESIYAKWYWIEHQKFSN